MLYPLSKNFRFMLLMIYACVFLVACSHERGTVSETIDLTTGEEIPMQDQDIAQVPEPAREYDPINISSMSKKRSEGRVRVYDPVSGSDFMMDDAAVPPQVAQERLVPAAPISVNRYVTVYPLEDVPAPRPVVSSSPRSTVVAVQPSYVKEDHIAVSVGGASSLQVHFDHNSAWIRAGSERVLDEIAQRVQAQPGDVSIEGHASRKSVNSNPTRRIMGNLKISMNRAYNVAKALVRRGVPAESIRIVGWGETRLPAVGADGEAARRVEVHSLSAVR